jgi:ABC-type hemin transport system substrate-binding protein
VTAVRTNRIRFLDENIASRFGPRLYDAFAELARLIHPELFEKTP